MVAGEDTVFGLWKAPAVCKDSLNKKGAGDAFFVTVPHNSSSTGASSSKVSSPSSLMVVFPARPYW